MTHGSRQRDWCGHDTYPSIVLAQLPRFTTWFCCLFPRPCFPLSASCHVLFVPIKTHVSRSCMPCLRMSLTYGETERLSSAIQSSKSVPVDNTLLVESLRELLDVNVRMARGCGGTVFLRKLMK